MNLCVVDFISRGASLTPAQMWNQCLYICSSSPKKRFKILRVKSPFQLCPVADAHTSLSTPNHLFGVFLFSKDFITTSEKNKNKTSYLIRKRSCSFSLWVTYSIFLCFHWTVFVCLSRIKFSWISCDKTRIWTFLISQVGMHAHTQVWVTKTEALFFWTINPANGLI